VRSVQGKLNLAAVALVVLAVLAIGAKNYQRNADVKLLNVSYDPLGGAVYQVGVNPSGKQALRADQVAALLARLVRPDRIESLALRDAGNRGHPLRPPRICAV